MKHFLKRAKIYQGSSNSVLLLCPNPFGTSYICTIQDSISNIIQEKHTRLNEFFVKFGWEFPFKMQVLIFNIKTKSFEAELFASVRRAILKVGKFTLKTKHF